ncbi:protein LEKR1 [Engraulis encrasicolus]|uniref:protein LEKR1 n=1 Tax=Engraulis encrasicolus TaxID=184585 RepID=UPI002FD195BA
METSGYSEDTDEMRIQTPSHPLPKEIQQMERSETECQYCGVSYLILHEFQRLQKRLAEAERRLEELRGSAEREAALRAQLLEVTAKHNVLQDREKGLGVQLAEARRELELVRGDRDLHSKQLEGERSQRQALSAKCVRQQQALCRCVPVLRASRQELQSTRAQLRSLKAFWEDSSAELMQNTTAAMRDLLKLQQAVGAMEEELKRQETDLSSSQQQIRSLRELTDRQEAELERTQEAHTNVQRLEEEVRSLDLKLQRSQSHCKHLEDQLQMRWREMEELRSGQVTSEHQQKEALQRLSQDLREKEESWLSCQRRCEALQEQLLAWQQKHEEMTRSLRRAEGEGTTLTQALEQAAARATATEAQRQEMSAAHVCELQRLEEDFRKKLQEAEEQKAKIEIALEQQRAEVASRLQEKEVTLRREAALEMDIERQKNQELLNRYQQENQELHVKLPSLVQGATQELQREVVALEEQLMEANARLSEQEQQREQEAQRLREEAHTLQRQLAQERSVGQVELQQQQQKHQQRAMQLAQALRDMEQLKSLNATLEKETEMLQETVRLECEEREGLTAALTEAKEQLLRLRQQAAQSPPSSSSTSSTCTSSSTVPRLPQRPSPPTPTSSASTPRGAPAQRRSSAGSWHGHSQTTTPTLPRLSVDRGPGSASEAHRRIAMLMGRKDSRM